MTSDDRSGQMDAARTHADLSVQDLWLRYVAMGGTGDAFDLDGYLQGLVPLDAFQQDVLAQAINEALQDRYRAHRVPLSGPPPSGDTDSERLGHAIDELIAGRLSACRPESERHRPDPG